MILRLLGLKIKRDIQLKLMFNKISPMFGAIVIKLLNSNPVDV